jgi:hypothetical protein
MSSLNSQEKRDEENNFGRQEGGRNDRENGNGKASKAVKRTKPAADEKYMIGSIETVQRGFLKEL